MNNQAKKKLNVFYGEKKIGTLAEMKNKKIAFAYEKDWLESGFSISPFSLPLHEEVFIPSKLYFDGLFGIFYDSLPDAWGQLLLERFLREKGFDYGEVSVLDRLSMVGENGMGALCYYPADDMPPAGQMIDFDMAAEECKRILRNETVKNLDLLYRLGGTSGGARPKIMTELEGKEWIIKFPAHVDPDEIGQMEYDYSLCAKACGIKMTETKLFPSEICAGYFGTVRFDRGESKIHAATAAAILESDYRQPSLDYHELMKLTKILTGDCKEDVENMFLRMCFNVLAHNRDDHAKNFSYLYQEENNCWHLAPAYDLTYSNTYYGEHTTSVDGNGKSPGREEILKVGMNAGIRKSRCLELYEIVQENVERRLQKYLI